MAEEHLWKNLDDDELDEDSGRSTARMKVPGGYLYMRERVIIAPESAAIASSMVFVPDRPKKPRQR